MKHVKNTPVLFIATGLAIIIYSLSYHGFLPDMDFAENLANATGPFYLSTAYRIVGATWTFFGLTYYLTQKYLPQKPLKQTSFIHYLLFQPAVVTLIVAQFIEKYERLHPEQPHDYTYFLPLVAIATFAFLGGSFVVLFNFVTIIAQTLQRIPK